MRRYYITLILLCLLAAPAFASIHIINNSDERLTYAIMLPNGDTKEGEIEENRGYGPSSTVLDESGEITVIRITSESGESTVELKAPKARGYLLDVVNGAMKITPISWYTDNGQSHKRVMKIYNGTGRPQTFDLIDEKEMRKGITLQPGETQEFAAKNGFGGSSGFHTLKFANGQRAESGAQAGYFVMLYNDKRYEGEVRVDGYGWLTPPR